MLQKRNTRISIKEKGENGKRRKIDKITNENKKTEKNY